MKRFSAQQFLVAYSAILTIVFCGRTADKSAVLRMRDTQGRDRLVIEVTADRSPQIRFLDEKRKSDSRVA